MSKTWRNEIKVHPAADLFPMMTPDELRALGEDIKKNGLSVPVVLWQSAPGKPKYLLDGRNRLDAMEAVGIDTSVWLGVAGKEVGADPYGTDPYAYVLSTNLHRRHLTPEQKRQVIAAVLKAQPGKSNRTIAKQTKVDGKTVGKVRRELEGRAEIPHVDAVEDTKGRKQPAKKKAKAKAKPPEQELPPNDVEAAENAAAQFLFEMYDLDEELERITVEMKALAIRLFDSLDMRDGETVADFIRRIDPGNPFESDKPQALIAEIASALRWSERSDLREAIKYLDYILARTLEKRSASAAQSPTPQTTEQATDLIDLPRPEIRHRIILEHTP